MQKRILFISRHSPYGSSIAREALDAVLASAAYDQQISLLFMDDGVFQLLPQQDPSSIGQKSFAAMLSILPLYDVNNIFVHQQSLQSRGIEPGDIILEDAQIIDSCGVNQLLTQQDQLLSF